MKILYPARVDTHSPISTIYREVGKRSSHDITAFVYNSMNEFELGGIDTIHIGDKNKKRKLLSEYMRINDFDLLHTGPISHNLAATLGTEDVKHVHTIHNAEWGLSRGAFPFLFRRILIQACNQLTAVSPYVSQVAQEELSWCPEITVVPNGVDTDFFDVDRASTVPGRVLYIGRCTGRKHPEIIPKLAEELPNYEFRIRIEGLEDNPSLYNKCKNKENIKILPYLSNVELAMEYSSASQFLAPYEREGFGMTVLEALSSGTRVIGLDSGNLPILLRCEGSIILPSLDITTWKEAISTPVTGTEEESARRTSEDYSWDTITSQYESVYESIN